MGSYSRDYFLDLNQWPTGVCTNESNEMLLIELLGYLWTESGMLSDAVFMLS